jgi:hypothetical protein
MAQTVLSFDTKPNVMQGPVAEESIYVDAAGEIVDISDHKVESAFLLVAKGNEIPRAVIEKYGDKLKAKKKSPPEPAKNASDKIDERQKRIVKPTGKH